MRDFIKEFLKDKTKIDPIRLQRKIKEVTVYSCPPSTNKQFINSKSLFDSNGNMIETKTYQGGKLVIWKKYNYKEDELVEKLVGKSKWKDGSFYEKDFEFVTGQLFTKEEKGIAEINEKGQKVISTFFSTGQLESRRFFNEKNYCIEYLEFSKKNAVIYKELYNQEGQLLEARRFKTDGSPLNYTLNTYDEHARLCRSVSISRTGYLTHDVVLKYNDSNLLIETIEHPTDPGNAFADLKDGSGGYNHKYSYTDDKLLDCDHLYLCGELIMSYKYSYTYW